jgi:cell filamentation protein
MNGDEQGTHESFYRVLELSLHPIAGRFDAQHLKRIHGHIFQDFAEYQPGRYREPQRQHPQYVKSRRLEVALTRHHVHYLPHVFAARVDQVLHAFDGVAGLRGLPLDQAADKLAALYGDLDHAHPFVEGNSRTLRTFTVQLAQEAGYRLDWGTAAADALARDRLYVARDVAVTQRAFPGLDRQRAMSTDSRAEYEAYLNVIARHAQAPMLRELIGASLTISP